MALPEDLRRRLADPHHLDPLPAELAAHLQTLALGTVPEPTGEPPGRQPRISAELCHTVAREVADLLRSDPHQLAKVMVVLWRAPEPDVHRVAAACCDPLGTADLKRLMRFLQKVERRLPDAAACDVLAAGCAELVRAHPALFLRESGNRLSSKRALVRRLGLALVAPLAADRGFPDLEALFSLLRPRMTDGAPEVQERCIELLVALYARDPERTERFLGAFRRTPAAQPTIRELRRRLDADSARPPGETP